jgi:hypothetical protein
MSVEQAAIASKTTSASKRLGVFAHTTHAERVSEDLWQATIDPRWNVLRGPNGGYRRCPRRAPSRSVRGSRAAAVR